MDWTSNPPIFGAPSFIPANGVGPPVPIPMMFTTTFSTRGGRGARMRMGIGRGRGGFVVPRGAALEAAPGEEDVKEEGSEEAEEEEEEEEEGDRQKKDDDAEEDADGKTDAPPTLTTTTTTKPKKPKSKSKSKAKTPAPAPTALVAPPGRTLVVKRLDEIYDRTKCEWTTRPSVTAPPKPTSDPYGAFAFCVVRRYNPVSSDPTLHMVTTSLDVKSPYLIAVGKEVIGSVQGISWSAKPLKIDPQILLAWLPELKEHLAKVKVDLDARPPEPSDVKTELREEVVVETKGKDEAEAEDEAPPLASVAVHAGLLVHPASPAAAHPIQPAPTAVGTSTSTAADADAAPVDSAPEEGEAKESKAKEEEEEDALALTYAHLAHLVSHLETEHAETLTELHSLLGATVPAPDTSDPALPSSESSQSSDRSATTKIPPPTTAPRTLPQPEITFDLLWALLKPRTLLYAPCPVTGAPRVWRIVQAEQNVRPQGPPYWRVDVEYVEANNGVNTAGGAGGGGFGGEGPSSALFRAGGGALPGLPVNGGGGGIDMFAPPPPLPPAHGLPNGHHAVSTAQATPSSAGAAPRFGLAMLPGIEIPSFKGAQRITALPAYPLAFHPRKDELRAEVVRRGRKWARLSVGSGGAGGVSHVFYRGVGYHYKDGKHVRISINSRVMIDWKTFQATIPNYELPMVYKTVDHEEIDVHAQAFPFAIPSASTSKAPKSTYNPTGSGAVNGVTVNGAANDTEEEEELLEEDDLLLASSIVYGFSLADKLWLEFRIDNISSFAWNDAAFENLVLPRDQKALIRTLVESHRSVGLRGSPNSTFGAAANGDTTDPDGNGNASEGAVYGGFDDFVEGKGQGLVINLFGNPGVGKSLTAEATSEHVRKPLYVVGAGDLGTNAGVLDTNLTRIFTISATWDAVVLIDEADVFLEERSFHNIERNAMVAVFLRQLEYFKGILFLTTNRVKTFDEAFQSRIHVSLRYPDLSSSAKRQIWVAFLRKAGGGSNSNSNSNSNSKSDNAKSNSDTGGLTRDELHELGEKRVNGRQIKNVVRTAGALAMSRREAVGYRHLVQVLDMMDQFEASNGMYQ